ncbi:MAG: S-ribosylhomocysteine lyase [Oscillospiraceae bacterium]
MPKVESFELDHTLVKAPYVRVAGLEQNGKGAVVQKFDLRFIQPNTDSIPTAGLHTLEHFLSIFLREKIEGLIDISPMGCRTGFYLVVWEEHPVEEITAALQYALEKVLRQTEVPAAKAKACGNYKDHSLFTAKEYAAQVLGQGISKDPFERRL